MWRCHVKSNLWYKFQPRKIASLTRGTSKISFHSIFYVERVTGVEPVSHPWQGRIIATIRYPQVAVSNNNQDTRNNNQTNSNIQLFNIQSFDKLRFEIWVLFGFCFLVIEICRSLIGWRPSRDSNPGTRFCRPLPNHSATRPQNK